MKKLLIVLVSLFALLALTGCGETVADDIDRYEMPTVTEEALYELPEYMEDGDVYRNFLYYGLYQTRGVWVMDITTGEVSLFSDAVEEPGLFSTDKDGLYVWDKATNEIVVFDYDGEIQQHIPMPDENRGELYFWQIDHYDGLLAVAARENVWTLEVGKTKWQEVDVSRYLFECIMNVRVRNKNSVVIVFRGQYDESSSLVIECDRKGKHAKVVIDESVQTIDITGGHFYMANGLGRIFEVTEKGKLFKMTPDPHTDLPLAYRIVISNQTMLVLWYSEKYVAVYPFVNESEIVRIVAPKSCQYLLRRIIDKVTDVSVQYQLYDDANYLTQLSTKQLALEHEYDLALISGTGEEIAAYLPGVLRAGQFVDLKYSKALSENLDEAYPAIREIMTYKDRLTDEKQVFGLPLSFSETFWGYRAEDMGSNAPLYDWSAKDLWKLSEQAAANGTAVFDASAGLTEEDLLLELMKSITLVEVNPVTGIQDSGARAKGSIIVTTAYEKLLSQFREHQQALVGNNGLIRTVGKRVFSPEQILIRNQTEFQTLLFPSADSVADKYLGHGKIITEQAWTDASLAQRREKSGMQLIDLTSLFIVNPNGSNTSGAIDLLVELTNEDNRYNASIFGSPLFPHLDQYYKENDVPGSVGQKVRRSIVQDNTAAYLAVLDERMADYYEGSTLNLLTVTDRAKDAVAEFVKGTLSVEDAAEILYQELVYTLKG